ncbi:MAG: exodeoxyribonuclease III [Pseudomonadota bacterium]|nr:exodeoxyribonuclease III [Pseudomonadota bacterium]
MQIASWNVNSLKVRLPQVLDWLRENPVDVLALQETKLKDENFPVEALRDASYAAVFAGQSAYNGVAVLSRSPITAVRTGLPELDDPQQRVLACTIGPLRLINLYVPNGQSVDSDKYVYKLDWLARLRDYLQAELAEHPHLAVVGDFNIAPDDRDVHDPAAWAGQVLCSEPERKALQALLDLGLTDSLRLHESAGGIYSWWDYRMMAFRRKRGLRIDLVLVSAALAALCEESRVDATPRGWERPSDHAPVIARFRNLS